jgi:hypothetical protein
MVLLMNILVLCDDIEEIELASDESDQTAEHTDNIHPNMVLIDLYLWIHIFFSYYILLLL